MEVIKPDADEKTIVIIEDTSVGIRKVDMLNPYRQDLPPSLSDEREIREEFGQIFEELSKKCKRSQDLQWRGKVKKQANMLFSLFNLDAKKPAEDGKISLDCLIRLATNLEESSDGINQSFRSTIDEDTPIRLLEVAKKRKEFLSKEEFITMNVSWCQKWSNVTEKKAMMRTLMTSLAYANEVRWWPPLFFVVAKVIYDILALSLSILVGNPQPNFCSNWILNPYRKLEPWRYVTYSLLHEGWGHLLNNAVLLLMVGIPLEMEHRWWQVAMVYSYGVACGSIFHYLFTPNSNLLGASAGVCALVTAHFACAIFNWKEDDTILLQKFTDRRKIIAVKTSMVKKIRLTIVVCLVLVVIIMFVYNSFGNCIGDNCNKVSHVAHFAGAFAGLPMAIVCIENRKKETWEHAVRRVVLALIITFYIIAVIMCFGGNNWFPEHFSKQETIPWWQSKMCCHNKIKEVCCEDTQFLNLNHSYCVSETYQFNKNDICCYMVDCLKK